MQSTISLPFEDDVEGGFEGKGVLLQPLVNAKANENDRLNSKGRMVFPMVMTGVMYMAFICSNACNRSTNGHTRCYLQAAVSSDQTCPHVMLISFFNLHPDKITGL